MTSLNFSIAIDENALNKEIQTRINLLQKDAVNNALSSMFMSHKALQWKRDRKEKMNPDDGLMTNRIDSMIIDIIESEEMQKYAKNYIERNFKKCLEEACDEAMKHNARKIAFSSIPKV
jgi:uncharacterized membrane-anchored protein YjiN (DUF445 family)